MITHHNKNFYINDNATLLMTGEVHYYRLDPKDWHDRLSRLKACGMNSVATYIPWVLHEQHPGQFDFDGTTNDKLNLRHFLELCTQMDLHVIVRPGPFVMAEMKNDGIPFFVYKDYPHLIPKTWTNQPLLVPTLDFLHPDFLQLTKTWYQKVNEVMLPFKDSIIMYQIDNEIGMLSWVSNTPILTDFQCERIQTYIKENSLHIAHYDFIDDANYMESLRMPDDKYATFLLDDMTNYMRLMFKEYAITLKSYAINDGFKDTLYAINIHGTGGGRGLTYPVGISQLYELLKDEGFITGSDVYFNEFTPSSALDMYNCNELTDCLNHDRPLTTLEFNAGDSNFGDDLGMRVASSNTDFKTRLHLLQNNRLLNYYLFCGGINDRFDFDCHDGNDRYATTGHKHGFASLIDPLGKDSHMMKRLSHTLKMYQNLNHLYATAKIDYDDIAFGFIPNYYKTEYFALTSKTNQMVRDNIQRFRDGVSWDGLGRSLRLLSYAYQAVDLQASLPKQTRMFVNLGQHCEEHIQRMLCEYVKQGNTLIICGIIPSHDLVNQPCTVLKDFLEIDNLEFKQSHHPYILSVIPDKSIDPYETHIGYAQTYTIHNAQTLYTLYDTNQTCGFIKKYDKGQVLGITFEMKSQTHVVEKLMHLIDLKPTISYHNQSSEPGIFLQSCSIENNGQFIYLMNFDEECKHTDITINNQMYPLSITLGSKEALNLPYNIQLDTFKVCFANSEIIDYTDNSITFKHIDAPLQFTLETDKALPLNDQVTKEGNLYHFVITQQIIKGDITIELS